MLKPFLAIRRDLPGGLTVMVTVEHVAEDDFRGELRVERRADPSRQRAGAPPLLAEVHGRTQDEVLATLRQVAEDEHEIMLRLGQWKSGEAPKGGS